MEWPSDPIFPAVSPTTSSTSVFRVQNQLIGIQLSPQERQDGMLFYEKKGITCHPVMYEWLQSVAQLARNSQRFNPTLAQLASPNCVMSSAGIGNTLVIVPKLTAPKFPTQFKLIQEKELSLICAYSNMEFDGTIHLSMLQAKEAALSIIEDPVSRGKYNDVIDRFLALSFGGPEFNGQKHVYVSSENLRRELPYRRKPAITHFHLDRNYMYPRGIKKTIRQILVSAPLKSDGSPTTQGQQTRIDLSIYDNLEMSLNNTCPICFMEGCIDDHNIISMNTTLTDMSFEFVNDDGRLSQGNARNVKNCNALLLLENLVERLCKEENVGTDSYGSNNAAAAEGVGIQVRTHDQVDLQPIVIQKGNVEHVIATPLRAGNPDGVSDGAMDGKAAKDEAVVYQEGKMLVQGNARIGVQGSTSGAGSSQPCNKQEMLEQQVLGALLRIEMRGDMKRQFTQIRGDVFSLDSKKLLPEAALLSGWVMEIIWSYIQPFLRVYCTPGDMSSEQLDGFITMLLNHLVLELSGKLVFNVDNGQIGVVDASGMSGAQAISYDLLDPEIYCNKTLHITLEDISDNEDDERQSGVVLDKGVKRKNSSTGEKNDRQVKRRHILSLEIDTDDVSFMHLSDKGSAQEEDDDVFEVPSGALSADGEKNRSPILPSKFIPTDAHSEDGTGPDGDKDIYVEGSDEDSVKHSSLANASVETLKLDFSEDDTSDMLSRAGDDFENLTLQILESEDDGSVLDKSHDTTNGPCRQSEDDGYGSQQLMQGVVDDSEGRSEMVLGETGDEGDEQDVHVQGARRNASQNGNGNGNILAAEYVQESGDEDDDEGEGVPAHVRALQMIELITRQSRRLTNRIGKELEVLWNLVKKK